MNSRSTRLVGILKELHNEKRALNALLKADQNHVFAYYIAPLTNIISIINSRGILPRENISGNVDVSSTAIQGMRNKTVYFSAVRRAVDLHKCINLFMNPINDTLFHFRRNALIQCTTDNPLSQIIGILEIDLESLLLQNGIVWEAFPENFIKAAKYEQDGYEYFPWSEIYTLTTYKDRNPNQAAEIILSNSIQLPFVSVKDITRVIVVNTDIPTGSEQMLDNLGFPIEIIDNQNQYSVLQDPLDSDRKFLTNLFSITNQGEMLESLINSLQRLNNIESEIGLSLLGSYQNQELACGYRHGVGHTIRVMFWVLFLARSLFMTNRLAITEEEITASLYAAFIHDLCRDNNQVDNNHGSCAADKFSKHLKSYLPQPYLDRCLNAVRIHSLFEEPKVRDVIWYLLKDADAIDRGRFGPPGKANGCQKEYLRLKLLRKDPIFTDGILWTSYFLSRMTNYINWKDYSCSTFVGTMLGSLQALANSPSTPLDHIEFANRIIEGLRSSGDD